MDKPLIVISSAFDTQSGYGSRSRDIIKELILADKYKVRLLPQRWGNTSWNFCESNPEWKFLLDYLINDEERKIQPDIWIQITVPDEFQPIGKLNIGITAGIETDICSPEWIEGLNRMDLNLVSSNHSRDVFALTKYNKKFPNGDVEEVSLKKPIKVLFEGVNNINYFIKDESSFDLSQVDEDFCFLTVGHWLPGNLGEDRKNIGLTIKTFFDAFKNQPDAPALILKVSLGNNSKINKYEIIKRIEFIKKLYNKNDTLPNIYLINGDISDKEMNELYNHPKIKSMVSMTKGEGFGRPLLEFMFVGKPIISPYWSGPKDFISKDNTLTLKGELKPISPSASNKYLVKEGKWFNVNENDMINAYRVMFNNYKKYLNKSISIAENHVSNFTSSKMGEKLIEIIDNKYGNIPKFQSIVMPDIINLNK